MKKKILILAIVFALLAVLQYVNFGTVKAETESEIEQNINQNVVDQLSQLDFSKLDEILNNLDDSYNMFGTGSFQEKIVEIVNGTYFTSFDNVFSAVLNLAFDGLVSIMPILLTIIAVAILCAIITNLKVSNNGGVNDIVHFVCYSVIILLIVTALVQIMQQTYASLSTMKLLMEASFPILLTLLTAIGAVSSVAIYHPIVAILSGGVTFIFTNVLYPIFILSFIFVVISNLSSTVKLNKFNDFLSSMFKWIVGFILTIFTSFLVIQGISAGKFDSVSIKATKFAVRSYVPIIGGFISEGFDFIILSSILIKNAIGVGVLFIVFLIALAPVIKIVIFKLGLQLVSAIIEPMGNTKLTNFISSCSKILIYPVVILLGVAFMFLITVALIMTTANVF